MAELPICFISYSHENADLVAIEHLVSEIRRVAKEKVRIVRDKENIRIGQSIASHEEILRECSAVIVLFTPEYITRIRNRKGGVHREYSIISARYAAAIEASTQVEEDENGVPLPPPGEPFEFIPILFAGTPDTAMPAEVSDSLWSDFTAYRVHRDDRGRHNLPDSSRRHFDGLFKEIAAIFDTIHIRAKRQYQEEYGKQLQLLFNETKHENLRKKEQSNPGRNFTERLFVKTHTYKKVISQQACIIIGRKGSGKSTIIDHFLHAHGGNRHHLIYIHLKTFEFTFLYNIVFSRPYRSEIGHLIADERFFEIIWILYIYRLTRQAISKGANRVVSNGSPQTNWGIFVDVVQRVTDYTSSAIDETAPLTNFYSRLADRLGVEEVVRRIAGPAELEALATEIASQRRRLLFGLDGFDLRFEDFRNHSLSPAVSDEERLNRNAFEVAWLKGLLRSILDLRSSDVVIKDKMDFCVSIPQDRYMEARELERDDYRFRNMASEIQWSAYELAILVRKRMEMLAEFQTDSDLHPLDRLDQVLRHSEILLPEKVEIRVGKNTVQVSLFKYILRHTFWRPRDILYYVAALLTMKRFLHGTKRSMNETILKEVVSGTTYNLIGTEFVKEFKKNFVNIEMALRCLRGLDIITKKSELEIRLRGVPFSVDGGARSVVDIKGKIDILYEIGLLGYEQRERADNEPRECFIFSDGDKEYRAISDEEIEEVNFVIHPIFTEYLRLNTARHRIVCVYADEYLLTNDLRSSM